MGNWRVGRKVGRTIYDGDTLIGVMDTPELAARVVEAVNRRTASPVAPEGAAPTPPTSDQRAYPCASCGVMRSASEGGTVFTVCDACWDDTVPSASATTEGPRGETKETG